MKAIADTKYVKEIITDYDKLSFRCEEFDLTKKNKDAQEIILSLKNTIRANDGMAALSAIQLGYDKRIICLNFNGNIRTFVNPIITNVRGLELSRETCHSEPGKTFLRPRNNTIDVTYQTPLGKIESIQLVGMAARMMQHHIDHLDGVLLSDIGLEIDSAFDDATDDERQEVINYYIDSLDLSRKAIETDIENDEESKQIVDAARFIESVQKGETILEPIDDEELVEAMESSAENKE